MTNIVDDAVRAVRETVRQHSPPPTTTRVIDFGEMGELEVEIAYDAGPGTRECFDTPGTDGWFHICEMRKDGKDIQPLLEAIFGKERVEEYAAVLAGRMEREEA